MGYLEVTKIQKLDVIVSSAHLYLCDCEICSVRLLYCSLNVKKKSMYDLVLFLCAMCVNLQFKTL